MEYKFKNGSFLKVIRSKDSKRSKMADEWMKYGDINLDKEEMKAVEDAAKTDYVQVK